MKLKLDASGNAVLQDGKPVYVADDGKEIPFDGAQAFQKITQLTGEAKGHRTRADTAEATLAAFKDIDPVAAKKAIDTVKNLDDKKLIDAGQAETIKTEAIRAVEEKYKPVVEERDGLKTRLVDLEIGGAFATSKFAETRVALPKDILRKSFGSNFKVEEGKLVARDPSGNPIYSRARPGELADFDEALEHLVSNHPDKDQLLRPAGGPKQGDGRPAGGTGGGAGGAKTVSRAEFNTFSPEAQMAAMAGTAEQRMTITD